MLYLFILAILTLLARAKDDNNHFTNPSSWTGINPEWQLGDQQVIAWKTTLGTFNISIWQQSLFQQTAASQGNVYSKIHASDKVTNFTWTVQLYGFDLDYSNVFFFWINSDTPNGFTSAYFNITRPDPATETSSSTASSTATSPPNATSSVSSPATTESFTPIPQPTVTEDPGLTTTAKVALGVGLGVGLPILATLAVLLWQRSRAAAPSSPPKGANSNTANTRVKPAELSSGPMRVKSSTSANEVPGTDPSLIYPELPDRSAYI
ncbi:hypothetical protein BJY04DRAFT_186241 [Aspergillus karnatakaensis]|uniref:uncharacterized protein n=1 Tax=Aspergillus karnatakaensis TaxID=1810916 RepID=UPI003CCD5849